MTNEILQNLIDAGNPERDLRLIDQRRKSDSEDPTLEALQGICHRELGDFPQAVEELEHAVKKRPGLLDAQSHLVFSLARLGRLNSAERWARKLLLNPATGADNLLKAAEALTWTRIGLARLLVKAAVAKAPKDALCWLAWGCILARTAIDSR